jgi:hypothetical protein
LEFDSNDIPYNFGDWHGIDVLGGYLASITNNVTALQGDYPVRMLFGTNFYIGRKPARANQLLLHTAATGLKVYLSPEAFPRAWSVHHISQVARGELGAALARTPLNDHREKAVMSEPAPQLGSCSGDEVRLAERTGQALVVEADMRCRGMVIVGETYFPGWQALVDGQPARIYETYGVIRGVVVEAGRHRLEMRFRPASVYWGAALTGLGLAGASLLAMQSSWRHLIWPGAAS